MILRKVTLTIFILFITLQVFGDYKVNFQIGKQMFNDGLYDESIKEFDTVIKEKPISDEAEESLLLIAESYRLSEKVNKAEATYQKLLVSYPKSKFLDQAYYRLGVLFYDRENYLSATINLQNLFDNYPKSDFTKQSIYYLLNSYYSTQNFNKVISMGDLILKNYPKEDNIPGVLLLISKAYYKKQMPDKAEENLKILEESYPQSDARWEAFEMRLRRIEEKSGVGVATTELKETVEKKKISRSYEQKLKYKLVEYYLELENYQDASVVLTDLMKKFSRSDLLDLYILKHTFCAFKLTNYGTIFDNHSKYEKVLKNSKLYPEFLVILAESYLENDKFDEVENTFLEIKTEETYLNYKIANLKAILYKKTGRLRRSINTYKTILNEFSDLGEKEKILMNIGQIYFQDLNNYKSALDNFQQVLSVSNDDNMIIEAIYFSALCYEKMGKFDNAISELNQIHIPSIENEKLRQKMLKKQEYYSLFKKKNYQHAFTKIIEVIHKNQMNEPVNITDVLTDILVFDLKEHEQSLQLISDSQDPVDLYKKGIIYLKLIHKEILESTFDAGSSNYNNLQEIVNLLYQTGSEGFVLELQLRKDLLLSEYQQQNLDQNEELIGRMESFLLQYPDNESNNNFHLKLADFYLEANDTNKAVYHLEKVTKNRNINELSFYDSKLSLAEIYFDKEEYLNAYKNYEISSSRISLSRPGLMYHYAVSLYMTGNKELALDKIAFLLNNVDYFDSFQAAVKTASSWYREKGDVTSALKISREMPERMRDTEYYKNISSDYLEIGDIVKAKESLMYIEKKDLAVTLKLADLHYKTKDLHMAAFTYKQVLDIQKKENQGSTNSWLGHIYYQLEDFTNSSKYYQKWIDDFSTVLQDTTIDKTTLIKEAVISNYKTDNRLKAESINKTYKKELSFNPNILNEIKLSEGIYYHKLDSGKANGIFKKIAKQEGINSELKGEAKYWQGIIAFGKNKLDDALKLFLDVGKLNNKSLQKQANLKLGTIYFSKEDYENSMKYYEMVIEQDSSGTLAFDAAKNYAIVAKTIEEWESAVEVYELILERWGDKGLEAKTKFDIAFCYFRDKKYNYAIDMFEKAIPLLEDEELQAESQYWIGESYMGMDDYEQAVAALLKVGYRFPSQLRWAGIAEFKAGESYLKMEQVDKAKYIFNRVIKNYGAGSDVGQQAKKRLATLE